MNAGNGNIGCDDGDNDGRKRRYERDDGSILKPSVHGTWEAGYPIYHERSGATSQSGGVDRRECKGCGGRDYLEHLAITQGNMSNKFV